jgi:hypothetical protein
MRPRQKLGSKVLRLRIYMALPFVAAALLLAIPYLWKRPVEVRMNVDVTRIDFDIRDDCRLASSVALNALSVRGFDDVYFKRGAIERTTGVPPVGPAAWRPFSAGNDLAVAPLDPTAQVTFRDVVLNTFDLAAGSHISIQRTADDQHSVLFIINGPPLRAEVSLGKVAEFSCEKCSPPELAEAGAKFRISSANEQIISLAGRSPLTTALITLASASQPDLGNGNIPIASNLTFVEHRPGSPRLLSSVIGNDGRIMIPDMNQEEKIGNREELSVVPGSDFAVRTIAIDTGIRLALAGKAEQLSVQGREVIPSWLEWLHARKAWLRYIEDIVLVGTAMLAILTRLKIIREEKLATYVR